MSLAEVQSSNPTSVTRDGMPVRSGVLLGDTVDVTTVGRIKDDQGAWLLGRCLFVGDARI